MASTPTGTVTFLFTDVEGSTIQWSRTPESMALAIDLHDALVRSVIERSGGYVFSATGDGFAAAFARCRDAVAAATAIQDAVRQAPWPSDCRLAVRVGLHVGEANERDGNYFGPAVNAAARVMGAGHGGQIVATTAVADIVGTSSVEFHPLGTYDLRGFDLPFALVQIGSGRHEFPLLRAATSAAEVEESRAIGTPIVDRERPLAELQAAVEGARRGRGRMVFLTGEPGAGKTTVVQQLAVALQNTTTEILRGYCDPLASPRPLGPFLDMGSTAGSALRGAIDLNAEHHEIGMEIQRRLGAADHAHVLVIEDVHWCDEATLEVLRFIARRVAGLGVVVLCTLRPDGLRDRTAVRSLIGELVGRPEVQRIDLEPLSLAAVTQLISESAFDYDAEEVFAATGGNPFFVTELLATDDDVPATVRDAVLARVDGLPTQAQELLRIASISARPLRVSELATVAAACIDQLDSLIDGGFLVNGRTGIGFRHELARAATYSTLGVLQRPQLHLQMLAALADARLPDAAELAHHAIAAADDEMILRYVPVAADIAERSGSQVDAAELLAAAIPSADRVDPAMAADLRIRRARMSSSPVEAAAELETVLRWARASGDHTVEGRALVVQAGARINTSRGEARRLMDDGIECIRRTEPGPALVQGLYASSFLHVMDRRDSPARDHAHEALRLARDLGEESLIAQLELHLTTIQLVTGDIDEALASFRSAIDQARASGELRQLSHLSNIVGSMCGERRRYPDAVSALEEAIAVDRQIDNEVMGAYARAWLARVHFERGDWEQAEQIAHDVVPGALTDSIPDGFTAGGTLGRLNVRRGAGAPPDELLEIAAHVDKSFLQYAWPPLCGLAEWYWLNSEVERGQELIDPLLSQALQCDSEWARGEVGFWAWRFGLIGTLPDGSAEPFVLMASERPERAAPLWQQIGCPYEEAVALAGEPAARDTAREIFTRLGAQPWIDRLDVR
ncbi:MAG: AAA family ATPase [Actinomycetota bacterium]